MSNLKGRGGPGRGQGRKPGRNKIRYATRLPIWLVEWLRKQGNQAEAIEKALVAHYKITPPHTPE